jgi:hypothetical protein
VLLAVVGSVLGMVQGAFQTPIRRSLALFYVYERSVHVGMNLSFYPLSIDIPAPQRVQMRQLDRV